MGEAQKIIEKLAEELRGIRAGRASAALVEHMLVECYGTKTPISALASIAIPDARTVVLEVWDVSLVPGVVEALERSSLGLTPVVDQRRVRLSLAPLTEERRKELSRLVSQRGEEARVALRRLREHERQRLIADERAKKISADEKFRQLKKLDKDTDGWMEKVEELRKRKEAEILQ